MNNKYNIFLLATIFTLCIFVLQSVEAESESESVYEIRNNQIMEPLAEGLPDPMNGREIVISRIGNCLACHKISSIDESFQGNIGPSLDGVGERYKEGELRLRLVNPYYLNPESLMPSFFQNKNLVRVEKKYSGKTILTARQIEDVISWLLTLK